MAQSYVYAETIIKAYALGCSRWQKAMTAQTYDFMTLIARPYPA